jgi:hypothetical protein
MHWSIMEWLICIDNVSIASCHFWFLIDTYQPWIGAFAYCKWRLNLRTIKFETTKWKHNWVSGCERTLNRKTWGSLQTKHAKAQHTCKKTHGIQQWKKFQNVKQVSSEGLHYACWIGIHPKLVLPQNFENLRIVNSIYCTLTLVIPPSHS